MRSENRITARITCSIMMTATPRSFMPRRSARISSTSAVERPAIASSAMSSRGLAADAPGVVAQGARDAVHERALARAVGPDEAEALAVRDREVHAIERREATEALRDAAGREQRLAHARRRFQASIQPMMPLGA